MIVRKNERIGYILEKAVPAGKLKCFLYGFQTNKTEETIKFSYKFFSGVLF